MQRSNTSRSPLSSESCSRDSWRFDPPASAPRRRWMSSHQSFDCWAIPCGISRPDPPGLGSLPTRARRDRAAHVRRDRVMSRRRSHSPNGGAAIDIERHSTTRRLGSRPNRPHGRGPRSRSRETPKATCRVPAARPPGGCGYVLVTVPAVSGTRCTAVPAAVSGSRGLRSLRRLRRRPCCQTGGSSGRWRMR